MSAIANIWREITTPSDASEGGYTRMLIVWGHALFAGALAGVLNPVLLALAYVVGKELLHDVWYMRGSVRDSIHDSGAVLFGIGLAVYFGPPVSMVFALLLVYGFISAVLYGDEK